MFMPGRVYRDRDMIRAFEEKMTPLISVSFEGEYFVQTANGSVHLSFLNPIFSTRTQERVDMRQYLVEAIRVMSSYQADPDRSESLNQEEYLVSLGKVLAYVRSGRYEDFGLGSVSAFYDVDGYELNLKQILRNDIAGNTWGTQRVYKKVGTNEPDSRS